MCTTAAVQPSSTSATASQTVQTAVLLLLRLTFKHTAGRSADPDSSLPASIHQPTNASNFLSKAYFALQQTEVLKPKKIDINTYFVTLED